MSLDVYLTVPDTEIVTPTTRIYVRENGATKEISRAEWATRMGPGKEPVTVTNQRSEGGYSANITHNLGGMAKAAGIYEALWRPDEIGITVASELIPLLEKGLELLKARPEYYSQFNAANGWGLYVHFVPFVENYLKACREYPNALVKVSR